MEKALRCLRLPAASLLLLSLASPLLADDAFYRGKRLTILVNYAAGGPTDVESRVLARHIGKYLDGSTGVLVQNMDGAGGLTGTNYLGEVAPKDGSVVGYLTGTAFQYAHEPRARRVDYLSYEFVAYQPGTSVYFMRTDVKPGMKRPIDLMKAENLIVGGLGADNAKDILLRLNLDMLGLKYNYVTSYKGSQGARMALQQGEINFYSESPPSYRGVIEPGLVSKGIVVGNFYDASYDGERFFEASQMKGVDMMTFPQFYKAVKGKDPEGELWEIYKAVIALNGAMQRMIVLPPNAPEGAKAALRKAVAKLNTDRDYMDDAVKTFGYVPEWVADQNVTPKVRKALVLPEKTRAFLKHFIENPPRNR
jgi:tripartite-type tricarboxylate transporter receptor subunit TctC